MSESFSDGDDGTQPTFALKVEDGATFMADTVLADASAGDTYVFAVTVTAEKKIQLVATDAETATDENDAGAINVSVIAVPSVA